MDATASLSRPWNWLTPPLLGLLILPPRSRSSFHGSTRASYVLRATLAVARSVKMAMGNIAVFVSLTLLHRPRQYRRVQRDHQPSSPSVLGFCGVGAYHAAAAHWSSTPFACGRPDSRDACPAAGCSTVASTVGSTKWELARYRHHHLHASSSNPAPGSVVSSTFS